jgi:hypothetical protein
MTGEGMKKLRIWAQISLTLGILSVVAFLACMAALTDIYHGEQDVRLEWTIVRLGFFVIFILIIAILVFTTQAIKYFQGQDKK